MKNYSKILLTIFMAIIATCSIQAQNKNKRPSREQFTQAQAQKIADELLLDEAAAKQFIATFTQCQNEIWNCAPKEGRRNKQKKEATTMTEDEAREIIKSRFAHRQQIEDIQQKYYTEYSKFLTQRQILRVYDLEKQMFDRMFRHRQEHAKDGKRPPRQPGQQPD